MLNKTVIMDLLQKGEYAEIIDLFTKEYKQIIEDFLINNKIDIKENESLIDLMYKVETNFPKHSGLMMLISRNLFNEDITMGDRIEKAIDNYKTLREKLT